MTISTDTESLHVKVTIELSEWQARAVAFLLDESYGKWGAELDHYIRHEDVYPAEVMEMLDTIDIVREQLVDQGIPWDPELPDMED